MNSITFNYNTNVIRTQVAADGEPLFCLADICKVLELANPTHAANAIKEEFGIPTLNVGMVTRPDGSSIEASFITEPQLYFVLMRSRSENARPFRQWVVNDVLPSIRKTGGYSVKPVTEHINDDPILQVMNRAQFLLSTVGIEGNQLALALDKVHKNKTGESLLALADVQLVAPQPKQLLNPTQLGKPLGLSAIKVNLKLEDLGLQRKTPAGWEPTEAGLAKGATMLDTGKRRSNGTPVRQLKWPSDILG